MLRAAAASLPNLTVTGIQTAEQPPALLAAVDCHVVPQDRAASDLVFPCKLGPILASGRPAIVTSDSTRELARWVGDAAAVVMPGDAGALADAIVGECRRGTPRNAARARALAASLDAEEILACFERVLQRSARVAAPEPHVAWLPAELAAG